MRSVFALLAAAFMALAMPAHAETTKWTGFYGGLHAGIDLTSTEASLGGLGLDGIATNGLAAGIHGGFDWQLPGSPLVIGIGADHTWSNTEFKVTPGILSAGLDDSWAVYARLGFAMDKFLPYALAGYTRADVSASLLGTGIGSTTVDGWIIGGGVEFVLAENVTLAGEYRFSKFDSLSIAPGFSLDTDRHQVLAALRYRFSPF